MAALEPDEALARYRELVAKVDATFAAIHSKHAAQMQCGRGCTSCCKPGLTVCAVENATIREYLSTHPVAPAGDRTDRCSMLASDGACTIYPVRPLVCRSHGAPLAFKEQGQERRDVCPLNFATSAADAGAVLEALSPQDCINLDTLNTLLALINKAYAPAASLARYPLAPA